MNPSSNNHQRRRALMRLALAGSLGGAATMLLMRQAVASGQRQGFTYLKGKVLVNGMPAEIGQVLQPGQVVTTGAGAEAIFVVGKDAFLQRENSEFGIDLSAGISVLRYVTGKILSVFGRGPKTLRTPTATIGIRGTGCYIESESTRTYFCLCYGEAELTPSADPAAAKIISTRHHEQPLYIGNRPGDAVMAAGPVVNHTDIELIMLENLVGREPPFVGQGYPTY